MFDPLGLFAPFSAHMRRPLKCIWTKNGQHWDNSIGPCQKEEFPKCKVQLQELAETSIDRRYFSTATDKWELHVFADSSEDTMCALAYLRLSICNQKVHSRTDATNFHTTLGTTSSSDGGETSITYNEGTQNEDSLL